MSSPPGGRRRSQRRRGAARTTWSATLAALAVAVVGAAACGSEGTGATRAGPATTAAGAAPTSPTATTATTAPGPGAGVWPFTDAAQADAGASDRTFLDPGATAREFAVRYLGMDDPAVFPFSPGAPGEGEVAVGPRFGEGHATIAQPTPTTWMVMRRLGTAGAWTVGGAHTPTIEVDTPRALDRLSSPAHLSGRASAFEGTVNVSVRQDGMLAGSSIGDGVVTGRGDGTLGPFDGTVAFRAPAAPGGAVLFVERSAADGSVDRATVVRVRF